MENLIEKFTVDVEIYLRKSTNEFVAQAEFTVNDRNTTVRFTGETENEARNALFAGLGCKLLESYYD